MRIFNNENLKQIDAIEFLRKELTDKVEYLNVSNACMGNDTIILTISFDKNENWHYGYLQNSNYLRFNIEQSGEVEVFECSLHQKDSSNRERLNSKFRKCNVKSMNKVVEKILIFVEKVNSELNICEIN